MSPKKEGKLGKNVAQVPGSALEEKGKKSAWAKNEKESVACVQTPLPLPLPLPYPSPLMRPIRPPVFVIEMSTRQVAYIHTSTLLSIPRKGFSESILKLN